MDSFAVGDGYPNPGPSTLQIEIKCGTGATFVNLSNYLSAPTMRIERDNRGRSCFAQFDLVAPGGAFGSLGVLDIEDNQEVHVWDTSPDPTGAGIAPYKRIFAGYISSVSATVIGNRLVYTCPCTDFNNILEKPIRQITTQWPPGDGTPVIATTSLTPITAGSARTFAPRTGANFYVGRRMIATNADGTNRERITISAYSGGVATATFIYAKTVADTTGTISSTGTQTITPASMTGITSGATLIIQNSDGTNEESVLVTAVTSTTFTASFTLAHGSGALIKVRWQLIGGITDREFLCDGWQGIDGNGTLTSYRSLLDTYFNDVGFTIDKNAVSEYCYSLPHIFKENAKMRDMLDEVQAAATSNYVDLTSTTVVSSLNTNVVITVANTIGMYVAQEIYCHNADGTNAEYVQVLSISVTTFTARFTSTKASGWSITATIAPEYWMTVIADSADHTALWTPTLIWHDKFDRSGLSTIALGDWPTLTSVKARYKLGYRRLRDGARRIFRQTVAGALGAQATYEETPPSGIRVMEGAPIVDTSITLNADALARATAQVKKFSKSKETISQVVTYANIDADLWRHAASVSFKHTLEAGTPAVYAIAHATLDYSEGVAKYTFELGDAFEELGDKPIPTFGAQGSTQLVAPVAVTWDDTGSPPAWQLSNIYDGRTDRATLHIGWNANTEINLSHYYIQWYFTGETKWTHMVRVNAPAHDVSMDGAPGTTITIRAFAVNLAGQYLDLVRYPPTNKSATMAGRAGPSPPTSATATTQYLGNGWSGIKIAFTAPASNYDYVMANAHPTAGADLYEMVPQGVTNVRFRQCVPGMSYGLTLVAYDASGNASTTCVPTPSPIVASPRAPEPNLYNADWGIAAESDVTGATPDGWALTTHGSATVARESAQVSGNNIKGQYLAKFTTLASTGSYAIATSPSVSAPTPQSSDVTGTQRLQGAFTYNAAFAHGYISVGLNIHYNDGSITVGPIQTFIPTPGINKRFVKDLTAFIDSSTVYVEMTVEHQGASAGLNAGTNTIYMGAFELETAILSTPSAEAPGTVKTPMGGLDGTGLLLYPVPYTDSLGNLVVDSAGDLSFVWRDLS